jgi:23S rRNA pseudouridine1911/1915/1917 synthase
VPATDWGWLITARELSSWTLFHNDEFLVVNKPALVVCHPSKHGPWSSLVGACREYLGIDTARLPSRLDRETSGVVVVAKTQQAGSRLQKAAYRRRVRKTYWAILAGTLSDPAIVSEPIGIEAGAVYANRQRVLPETEGGKPAETEFVPVARGGGYTLARVHPRTGRLHQIRVHAAFLGHPVAGDKLYPDPELMMEFVRQGFTPHLAERLPLNRHALHAAGITFHTRLGEESFAAPLAGDMVSFCRERMGVDPARYHSEYGVPSRLLASAPLRTS